MPLLTTTNSPFRLLSTSSHAKILNLEEWHREQLSLRAGMQLFKSPSLLRNPGFVKGSELENEELDLETESCGDPPLTQERERDVIWFTDHFLGRAHHTYLALDPSLGPLAVSIISDPLDHTYKLVIRSTSGSIRTAVPFSSIPPPRFFRRLLGYGNDPLDVLTVASPQTPQRSLRYCTDPYLPKELLAVEERQIIRSYKFGVAYVGGDIEGTENGMLACKMEQTSPAFHEFLGWLGDTIELKGWKGYRGGLDIKDNSTGIHSVYTEFHGYEIMYHVAPLLPNTSRDEQHVERKRHLGNDIVLIVFNDRIEGQEERIVELETVTSRQNHIVCVVSPSGDDSYDIAIAAKDSVPHFTPSIPQPARIRRDARSKEWLLHKLINGERAAYKAPCFAPKISRTRQILLHDVAERFLGIA